MLILDDFWHRYAQSLQTAERCLQCKLAIHVMLISQRFVLLNKIF